MKRVCSILFFVVGLTAVPAFAGSNWANSFRGLELTAARDADVIAKTEILTVYGLNHWLYQMPLQVKVINRTAIISGFVENDVQKHLALEIAKAANGIQQVGDKVQINPDVVKKMGQIKFVQQVRDLNTTGKIMEKLAKNISFSGRINVISYQGNVILSGNVRTKEQKAKVEKIATETMGVKKVTSHIEVGNDNME